MRILAMDSSSLVASVAVVADGVMMAEYTVNYKKTHSQTLLPMLSEITKTLELDLNTIDAIAVSAGPGSFTGLRIGSATAKGLGLALDKPVIPVPTIAGMAYNFYGLSSDTLICPVMDARRNQVYTGVYAFEGSEFVTVLEQTAMDIRELIMWLNDKGRKVIFLGDGVPVYKEVIEAECTTEFSFAPLHMARQRAGAVAALGEILYSKGIVESATEHKPEYLRKSQAERELAEKNGQTAD